MTEIGWKLVSEFLTSDMIGRANGQFMMTPNWKLMCEYFTHFDRFDM